ncbi:uncharacterized protein LOC143916065 [Arctopsyche grandis]|uniref:uncharacterized protein LOC143916065 n=1 Tax=Arctopsyche grandis TaxID=121162 RepID=UPI00406D63E9
MNKTCALLIFLLLIGIDVISSAHLGPPIFKPLSCPPNTERIEIGMCRELSSPFLTFVKVDIECKEGEIPQPNGKCGMWVKIRPTFLSVPVQCSINQKPDAGGRCRTIWGNNRR